MRISDWSSDVCSSDLAGTLQNMLSPRMRATGTAFTSMIYTMGGGIGPVVLGVLSGHYVSRGINSGVALGLAMASMSLLYLWAAGHYWRASRKIGRASCRERVCQYV